MRAYKHAIRGVIIALACVIVPQSAFAYTEFTWDGTNLPDIGTGSNCLIIMEDQSMGTPPNVSGTNYPFSGTGYINNSGGVNCDGGTVGSSTSIPYPTYPDGVYVMEWGANALFPFTALYWSYVNVISGVVDFYVAPTVDGITSTIEPTADTFFINNPVPFQGLYNNGITGAYDQIQFDLTNTTQAFQMSIIKPTTLVSGTDIPYSFEYALPLQGTWEYNARLWDTANATGTAWFIGNSFMLGTTTTATSTPVSNAPEIECSTFDFLCYLKKAFVWLIYPTESVKESFDGFISTIQTKPPVGYFNLLRDNLNGINASSTPAVTVTIPASIKNVFFTPFDIAIAGILWFFFAIHFYKRLKDITL